MTTGAVTAASKVWALLADVAVVGPEPPVQALEIVRAGLRQDKDRGDDLAAWVLGGSVRAERVRQRLAKRLSEMVSEMRTAIGMDGDPPSTPRGATVISLMSEGTMLSYDSMLADWLIMRPDSGDAGVSTAAGLRVKAAARYHAFQGGTADPATLWAGWIEEDHQGRVTSPALIGLARVIWDRQDRDALNKQRAETVNECPGLNIAVLDNVVLVLGVKKPHVKEPDSDIVVDDRGVVLGRIATPVGVDLQVMTRLFLEGAVRFRSIDAHRVLRWVIREAQRRYFQEIPDARVLSIEGGWRALYEQTGGSSHEGPTRFRRVVLAIDALRVDLPDGSCGRLLSVREHIGGGAGNPHQIEITAETPLLPHYGRGEKTMERRLVPLVGLPPMFGGRRTHGPLATFQLLVTAELRRFAADAYARGSVELTEQRWVDLARPARVLHDTAIKARDVWIQDGDDAPAFLERVDADRYRLGPAHRDAWEFITIGGKKEVEGRKRGKRSVAKRAAKLGVRSPSNGGTT